MVLGHHGALHGAVADGGGCGAAGTAEDDVEELARVPNDWKGEDKEGKGGHGG